MKAWEHFQELLDAYDGTPPPGWEPPADYYRFLQAMAQPDPNDGEWSE